MKMTFLQHILISCTNQCDGLELTFDCETGYEEVGLRIIDQFNDLYGNQLNFKITHNRIIKRENLTLSKKMIITINKVYKFDSSCIKMKKMKLLRIISDYQYPFNISLSYNKHEFCKLMISATQNSIFNIVTYIYYLIDKQIKVYKIINKQNKVFGQVLYFIRYYQFNLQRELFEIKFFNRYFDNFQ
ncbi:unnamed protein product [Paramecium sonneborni]|uniref:Uncharacterized protein n=1 Tax=Paramecium sonneborni TaxID=65129 RepID=A0A8S1K6L8_9CILI|nr:unnamed protein product [Paramecium sonneborni]